MRWPVAIVLLALPANSGEGTEPPFAAHDARFGRPELPRVAAVGDLPPLAETLVVHLARDGALRLGDAAAGLSDVRRAAEELRSRRPQARLLLRADGRLPAEAALRVIAACAEAGIDSLLASAVAARDEREGVLKLRVARRGGEPPGPTLRVPIRARGGGAAPEALAETWRALDGRVAAIEFRVDAEVPWAFVAAAASAAAEAGARSIALEAPGGPAPEDLRKIVDALAERTAAARPSLDLVVRPPPAQEEAPPPGPRPPPGNPVEMALAWLAAHQDPDGGWDCDGFMKHDPADDRCDGAGKPAYDVGVTALATLAFFGAGYTDRGTERENPHARTVRLALRYLVAAQDADGCFGAREDSRWIYNHALATLAMSEAFWMTRNPRYRRPAEAGLRFLCAARNPDGAWRYGVRPGESDTSVTAWCVMALKSGRFAGLDVDPDAFEGARRWIDAMTDPDTGKVGYTVRGGPSARSPEVAERFPATRTEAMTAAGILARVLLGEDPQKSPAVRKGAALCLANPPRREDGAVDFVYWHHGTLALFHVGGNAWREWDAALEEAVVARQHPPGSGARAGSWDPVDAWGAEGGRVYATATLAMALEAHYRYDRVFGLR